MKRLGDDITNVFLPSNRSECNYEQLRHMKSYELNEDGTPGVTDWLLIACEAAIADELIATNDPDILAEALDDCFQACYGSEVSFLEFPIQNRYVSETVRVKYPENSVYEYLFWAVCAGR